jgi:hypothetical protein
VRNCGTVDLLAGEHMAKISLTKRELTHVEIANRAFEIYLARGGEHGHDFGDWFEAERQLRSEPPPKKRAVKRARL